MVGASLIWILLATGAQQRGIDWEGVGAARLTQGDVASALDAWNHVGQPIVDRVVIKGTDRTDPSIVRRAIDLPDQALLTSAAWQRARRRLLDLPSATVTLECHTADAGHVVIEANVDEDRMLPLGLFSLSALAGKLIVLRDLQLPVKNLFHRADDLTLAFRFPSEWRRALIEYSSPIRGTGAAADVQASWERQTYALSTTGDASAHATEDHLQQQAAIKIWTTRAIRWQGGVSIDRWNNRGHVGGLGLAEFRVAHDRISIGVETSAWAASAGGAGFARTNGWAAWRSSDRPERGSVSLVAQSSYSTAASPFDLWSGAGTGIGRPSLLRAHSVIVDDVIGGPTFGRSLAHATVEYQHPVAVIASTPLGWAVFADTARASHRVDGTASPWFVDAGAGLRWTAPGLGSVIRLDVAYALRGGGVVLSAGWAAGWPR